MSSNPSYRTKAHFHEIALSALNDDMLRTIVRNAGLNAMGGSPASVNAFMKLLGLLGIDKIDPDMQDRHELKAIVGNPTPGMMKRLRPKTTPHIVVNNESEVG